MKNIKNDDSNNDDSEKVCSFCQSAENPLTGHHFCRQKFFNLPVTGGNKNNGHSNNNGNGKSDNGLLLNGSGNPFLIDLCYKHHQHPKIGLHIFLDRKEKEYMIKTGRIINKEAVYGDLKHYVSLYLRWHQEFFDKSEEEILSWIYLRGKGSLNFGNKALFHNGGANGKLQVTDKLQIVEFFDRNFLLFQKSGHILGPVPKKNRHLRQGIAGII